MNNKQPQPVDPPVRPADQADTNKGPTSTLPGAGTAAMPQRIGDYAILGTLGEGGWGTVYLAEDARLGRKVAIKTLKREMAAAAENRERFLREARAAAAIEHDNVVPIWGIGEAADGSPFIAMPFLQGETLEARLRREPIPKRKLTLKAAREVAGGLAAAHAHGLIHRDIKPGNVWLEGDPNAPDLAQQVRRCKILDFGLARSLGVADVQITASGMILGTPAYMAPEQARGDKVDHRADLFSLGGLLYRMSTGRLPFPGPNVMAVLSALATVTPPPARSLNPRLPEDLSDLIDRLLCKDPAGRPQSAAEVAAAVRRIAKEVQGKKSGSAVVPSLPAMMLAVPDEGTIMAPVPRGTPAGKIAPAAEKTLEYPGKAEPAPWTGAKGGRSRAPLLAALAFLALAPLGWWLIPLLLPGNADKGTPAGGSTDAEPKEVAKKSRDPDRKAAGVPKPVVKKKVDPDREAAEWVLSIGGTVRINRTDREIKASGELPVDSFDLTGAWLNGSDQIGDKDLASLKDCKGLRDLDLNGTKVGDSGLAHLKGCKELAQLRLGKTKVSDAGLAQFKGRNNFTLLDLSGTQVTDLGIAHLQESKNLTILYLQQTQVTASGAAELKKALPQCRILWDEM